MREEPVAEAKRKPDPVWLRKDSDAQWRKVVVDVKVTSSDEMAKAFKEKDDTQNVDRPANSGRKWAWL